MRFHRRQLLRILSFAFGSSFILSRDRLGIAAQTGTQPMTSPPAAGAVVRNGAATGAEMEKVTGIGGLFFRAHDPKALGGWYQQHLGVSLTPSSYEEPVWEQEAGPTVFAPFPPQGLDGELSSPGSRQNGSSATNCRNRDQIDPKSHPNGRFARLYDPEGNPIELWQPARPNARR
jgi:glyoxylase I family protein